jgi:membrane protein
VWYWLKGNLKFLRRLGVEVVKHTFYKDNAALLAAAIAFYSILSFIPLVLILISISSFAVRSSDIAALELFTLLDAAFPTATSQAFELISGVISQRHLFGIIGVLALTWSASRIFNVAESAMNIIWKPERVRPYWKSRLLTLGLVPLSVVLLLFSFTWTTLNSLARGTTIPGLEVKLADTFLFAGIIPVFFPVLLSFLLFFFVYRILPSHRPSFLACLIGAAFASLVWEGFKLLFDLYVKEYADMNKIYGSLGGIIVLILWVYYSSYILIVGAEVGANFERLRNKN